MVDLVIIFVLLSLFSHTAASVSIILSLTHLPFAIYTVTFLICDTTLDHSTLRTAGLTSLSCALTATACFGTERVAYFATKKLVCAFEQETLITNISYSKQQQYLYLTSHAIGGMVGGAWLGTLYLGRPWRGVVFFTPLMMLIATAEGQFRSRLMRQRDDDTVNNKLQQKKHTEQQVESTDFHDDENENDTDGQEVN